MSDAVARFAASMNITYLQWHDGEGYDLGAIKAATQAERADIERLLLGHGIKDWRDIQALTALDTEAARAAIRATIKSSNPELRLRAVQALAGDPNSASEREAAIVHALETANLYGGLSQALDAAAEHPTPAIKDPLFRCALNRDEEAAVHAAALLFYLYGVTKEPFDWSERPFFLKFATSNRSEREAAFKELCARVKVLPDQYF